MLERLRSDPFCDQYKHWVKTGAYKNDPDRRIFNIIKDNLKLLSEIPNGESITQLEFKKSGEIKKIEGGIRLGQASVKSRDLAKFTEFVQRYFKNKSIPQQEAEELRTVMRAASEGAEQRLSDVSTSQLIKYSLQEASEEILCNEKMDTQVIQIPGKDLVVSQFAENQNLLKASKAKLNKFRLGEKITKGLCVITGIGMFAAAVPIGLGMLPIGLPIFVGSALVFLGGCLAIRLIKKRDKLMTDQIEIIKKDLETLSNIKEHYEEPEILRFKNFLSQLPPEKISLVSDPKKFKDLHRLYDIEKELNQSNDLQQKGNELRKQLGLPESIPS
jgi:hypothetical protein